MKKTSLIFTFILIISYSLNAQELFVGVKGGLNMTNISNDKDNHGKFGLHAGGYFGVKFAEKMAGSIEVLYSQKGTHHRGPRDPIIFNGSHEPVNGDVMVHIDYIDIPILFHYYLSPQFNVHGGITIGSPVRGVRVWRDPLYPAVDFSKDIYQTVGSIPIGVTYELGGLNLGARVDLGLSPVGGDQRKNIVLMFSLGYTFYRKGVTTLNIGKSSKSENK